MLNLKTKRKPRASHRATNSHRVPTESSARESALEKVQHIGDLGLSLKRRAREEQSAANALGTRKHRREEANEMEEMNEQFEV